jgi:hypothetical protein
MSHRATLTSLLGLVLGVGACAPTQTDRPIDTTTAYECRQQAMAASRDGDGHNWPLERDLYNQCLRAHGYRVKSSLTAAERRMRFPCSFQRCRQAANADSSN